MILNLKSYSSTEDRTECTITGDHTVKFSLFNCFNHNTFLVEVDGKLMAYEPTKATLASYKIIIEAAHIFKEVLCIGKGVLTCTEFIEKTENLTNYYLLSKVKTFDDFIKIIENMYVKFHGSAIPITIVLMITKLPGLFLEPIVPYSLHYLYYFSYKDGDKILRVYFNIKEGLVISTDIVSDENPIAKPITDNKTSQKINTSKIDGGKRANNKRRN